MTTPLVLFPDPASLAAEVAERFLGVVRTRSASAGVTHVALTGGTMGIAVLRAAAESPAAADTDWSRVHFWWGDERFVPHDHADRNAGQARTALLDHIAVPAENVHEMPASDAGLTLDEAAAAYAAELAAHAPEGGAWPAFDVCFLGMGPDGHIASLFPGRDEIDETAAAALPVRDSPKPPPERVTLTLPVLDSSARVWLVVAGRDKAEALAQVRAGAPLPAARVRGRQETVIFADPAAAG